MLYTSTTYFTIWQKVQNVHFLHLLKSFLVDKILLKKFRFKVDDTVADATFFPVNLKLRSD